MANPLLTRRFPRANAIGNTPLAGTFGWSKTKKANLSPYSKRTPTRPRSASMAEASSRLSVQRLEIEVQHHPVTLVVRDEKVPTRNIVRLSTMANYRFRIWKPMRYFSKRPLPTRTRIGSIGDFIGHPTPVGWLRSKKPVPMNERSTWWNRHPRINCNPSCMKCGT